MTTTDHTASDTNEIIDAIARALWLSAYADGIERKDITGPEPGAQEDWNTYAPETPASARGIAEVIAEGLATLGRGSLVELCDEWRAATENAAGHRQDADGFGHAIGMQWLGHGVGLGDDIPWNPDREDRYVQPDVGNGEYYILEVDDLPEGVAFVQMICEGNMTVRVLKIDGVLTIDIETEGEIVEVRVDDSTVHIGTNHTR